MEERKHNKFGIHTNKTLKYCPVCDLKVQGNVYEDGIEYSLSKKKGWEIEQELSQAKLAEEFEDAEFDRMEDALATDRQKAQKAKKQQREQKLKEKEKNEKQLRKELGLHVEEEKEEEKGELVGICHEGYATPNEKRQLESKSKTMVEVPRTNQTAARQYCRCQHPKTSEERVRTKDGGKRQGEVALETHFS
eukprot:TRINITY_DN3233_c0_g1_i1.p1 TRINITY_DN3233_c0_g1~~TRINITY_DN3233_c0_g1_i1.p1  ORF type:complete len:192 (-),score=46.34 TRINITY_DN3233_c0_g1_i1:134-709(-)